MMQYNHESDKVEGKQSYNFYMGGKGDSKKGIVTPNKDIIDLSGKKLDLMKVEAGVKSDEDYEAEIQGINDYNEALLTPTGEGDNFKFNGNTVLIRLFKHQRTKKVGSLYTDNTLVLPYQTEGGKIARMENPLQFIHAGVINAISDQCTEAFRNKFKVGDVIHLKMGLNLMQQRCWLDPCEYYEEYFNNWFLINENMIEKGVK
jgi:hypothetical protein